MKIAVSPAYWLPSMASTISFVNPSNRSSFEDDGWPSTNALGFTNETAGSVPPLMSEYRLGVPTGALISLRCASRTVGLLIMEVSYWKGLQMVQYSSAAVMVTPSGLSEPTGP